MSLLVPADTQSRPQTLGLAVYRIFFHPLAKYPGPLLAKLTDAYQLYHAWKGDRHLEFWRLHQRYGPAVRFSPNGVCFNSQAALKDVYGFRANVRKIGRAGYPFDINVLGRTLHLARELARACPDMQFVLDHCGTPDIAGGDMDPWREGMRRLASLPHVNVKLSGISAYTAPDDWDLATLRPWIDHHWPGGARFRRSDHRNLLHLLPQEKHRSIFQTTPPPRCSRSRLFRLEQRRRDELLGFRGVDWDSIRKLMLKKGRKLAASLKGFVDAEMSSQSAAWSE